MATPFEIIMLLGGTIAVSSYYSKRLQYLQKQMGREGAKNGGQLLAEQGLNKYNHSSLQYVHAPGFQSRFEDFDYVRDDLANQATRFVEINPNELMAKTGWDLLDIKPRKEDMWTAPGAEQLDPLFGYDNASLPVLPVIQPPYYRFF